MKPRNSKPSMANVALGLLVAAIIIVTVSHTVSFTQQERVALRGVPDDWTHHAVIYSHPGTAAQALAEGRVERWYRTINNPRFQMQQIKRNLLIVRHPVPPPPKQIQPSSRDMYKDWSVLPTTGAVTSATSGVYPAKWGFYTTGGAAAAQCSTASPSFSSGDYIVVPTGVAGSGASTASIVAYDNLYSGCSVGTVPSVYWAADVNSFKVVTSPILSYDGTQVAFVGGSDLVVLNMPTASSYVNSATVANVSSSTNVNGATFPVSAVTAWYAALSHTDTTSSPFYDYTNNILYVGDSSGYLHKFTNVFHNYDGGSNTTQPTEATGSWPVSVSSAALLNPVYDSGSTLVFVPAVNGGTLGLASVTTGTTPTVVRSVNLIGGAGSLTTPAVVDGGIEKVYLGIEHGGITGDDMTADVYQFPTGTALSHWSSGTPPPYVELGASGDFSDGSYAYFTFDNGYYTTASGNMYACGANSGMAPELYKVPVSGSGFGTVVAGPPVGAGSCSPMTEIYTGSNDYIFLSQNGTNQSSSPTICAAGTGCIFSFELTGISWSSTTASTANSLEASGTSGIIVDNAGLSTPSGTANIYFSVVGSGDLIQTLQTSP